MTSSIPCFFHRDQLNHKPLYEWAFGEKIPHPETTSRAESILAALNQDSSLFSVRPPIEFPLKSIKDVHNRKLITLYQTAMNLPLDKTFYPSVFPNRETTQADPHNIKHAGAYCFDSGTPLNATTWAAAAWSAACAEEAALALEKNESRITYALCRPPGHHASKNLFGGYCYFNNAGIAAQTLRKHGRVVIVDIDFHHGNGTQSLFYRDPQVFVLSIHGDPREFYPFYFGFSEETGKGDGEGFNLNIPLPAGTDGQEYFRVIEEKILKPIKKFDPKFLIISAGFDTYVADPVGAFSLQTQDYEKIGGLLASLKYPTVVVQEGGYEAESLGTNVTTFLRGLARG